MNPVFSLIRERPFALSIGLVGRFLDYLRAAVDRVKSKIPKEAYALALLNSYLKWHHGTLARPKKGFLRISLKENDRELAVNIRSHSSDIMTFGEVIMAQEYLPIIELIKQKSSEPIGLIVDVGANIGISTLFFKSHFPNASVICIEPDPDNIALLHQNFHDNKLTNCEVMQGGLWYRDHQLDLAHDFRDGLPWSIRVVEQANGKIKGIGISSLLEHCPNQRIGLLKIDIEGSEFEIFRKAEAITELLSQTDFLVAEIHEEFGSFSEIQQVLSQHGFCSSKSGNLLLAAQEKQ